MIAIAAVVYLLVGFLLAVCFSELIRRDQGQEPHWFLSLAMCVLWPVVSVWGVVVIRRECQRQRLEMARTDRLMAGIRLTVSDVLRQEQQPGGVLYQKPEHN